MIVAASGGTSIPAFGRKGQRKPRRRATRWDYSAKELAMIDRYSKVVLTVIAIALVVQIAQRAILPSAAQYAYSAPCSADTPCPVYTVFKESRNGNWHPCYQKKEAC
jgi:hypothetical protein